MSNSTKKGFGVYATLVSAVLAIAAAVIYQVIGGKFGATQRVCYDPVSYTHLTLPTT